MYQIGMWWSPNATRWNNLHFEFLDENLCCQKTYNPSSLSVSSSSLPFPHLLFAPLMSTSKYIYIEYQIKILTSDLILFCSFIYFKFSCSLGNLYVLPGTYNKKIFKT